MIDSDDSRVCPGCFWVGYKDNIVKSTGGDGDFIEYCPNCFEVTVLHPEDLIKLEVEKLNSTAAPEQQLKAEIALFADRLEVALNANVCNCDRGAVVKKLRQLSDI